MLHSTHICTHIFAFPPAAQDEIAPVLFKAAFFICAWNLIPSLLPKDLIPIPLRLVFNFFFFSVKTYSLEALIYNSIIILRIH